MEPGRPEMGRAGAPDRVIRLTRARETARYGSINMERVTSEPDVNLDRSSPVPLYFQLAGELERAIAEGRLVKGGYLKNEIDLSELWQLSRPTVRRAIEELVDNGLLVRQRGVGTRVVNDQIRPRVRLRSLYDELVDQGRNPTTTVIAHEQVVADAWVSDALALPRGSVVVQLERCRYADGRRLAILRNWLTVDAAGDIPTEQLLETGLYALLRARGVWPHYLVQRIGARGAAPTDAALLDLPVGAPLLTMHRQMQSKSGARVDIGEHVYDASLYSVETALVETQ
jgi:DNA-binding GntR family transcriptional regulator